MQGLGFLIWKMSSMPPVGELIQTLQAHQVRWVSIKAAEGVYKFNVPQGDAPFKAYIQALQGAGIEVGGWHYCYPEQPGPQGDLAEERRQKLGLQHWLADPETEWLGVTGGATKARTYLSKIKKGGFTVGLCSFRYPSLFPNFPWAGWINQEAMDVMAPQVYPIEVHNFGQQLMQSKAEYATWTDKPFMPIGPTFGAATRSGAWWEPTAADLQEFVLAAQNEGCPAWGFYSLDWIYENERWDWLEAISGVTAPPPPPPPVPGDERLVMRVISQQGLNVRAGPGTNYLDVGDLLYGEMVQVEDVAGSEAWVKIGEGQYAGRWCCVRRSGRTYLEKV